jgi:hypothetical protein
LKNEGSIRWIVDRCAPLAMVIAVILTAGCDDEEDPGLPGGFAGGFDGAVVDAPFDVATGDVTASDAQAGTASAASSCDNLPNPIYLQIGDTQEPHIKDLGKRLRDSTVPGQQMTLIYVTTGSCSNIEAAYKGLKITVNPKYIPSSQELPGWTPQMAAPTCTIDPAGKAIDIANSALLNEACTKDAPPPGLGLFQGANQAYLFVVPEASTQKALTAEEAYFVFGFGTAGMAAPWTDEAFYFIRTTTKSTLVALAANIRVPAAKWKGRKLDQSTEVVNGVAGSTSPEKTIGILGAEIYEQSRGKLNALAFAAYKQTKAYFADSTSDLRDKRHMRDGHYTAWSPTVYMTRVGDDGVPVNPRAKLLLDLILARPVTPAPGFDPLEVVIAKGLVPQCAMRVTRQVEGGPLSPYEPPEPCHCFFETKVSGTVPASCAICTTDASCGGGRCLHGFCEKVAQGGSVSHEQLINAPVAADAEAIAKAPTLPLLLPGGALPSLP